MSDWYTRGFPHIWLPYTQMKTAAPALAAARTYGSRIVLSDGRELVDGIASWWTAAHGYNHPHIRARVEDAACDAGRAGARTRADAGRTALRAAAGQT
jgi:adenosylmethionine-8-amino-7-oxononanoate aminotransferase